MTTGGTVNHFQLPPPPDFQSAPSKARQTTAWVRCLVIEGLCFQYPVRAEPLVILTSLWVSYTLVPYGTQLELYSHVHKLEMYSTQRVSEAVKYTIGNE